MKKIILILLLTLGIEAKNIKQFKQSCLKNKAESCLELGVLYQLGKGIKKDFVQSKNYYTKACKMNLSEGCLNLGDLYFFGEGIDQNNSMAKKYYDLACNLKNKQACSTLKELEKEESMAQDSEAELERLQKEQQQLIKEAELLDNL